VKLNFDRALFFALQRLDSPGMRLKPEEVASISAVCKGIDMKDAFIWLPTGFGTSVCYETTPFVTETSWIVSFEELTANHGSIAPVLVQFQYNTSHSSTWIGNVICPSSSVLA